MKSPFPGMDPYLESRWEGVHQRLVLYATDAIQPQLPEDLWALGEERAYVESKSERTREIIPDVQISETYPPYRDQPSELRETTLTVAEPIEFDLDDVETKESYIVIRERHGGKLITVIEFLSVANKSGGTGEQKYLEKQTETLDAAASLVEIDLVRAGHRVFPFAAYKIPLKYKRDYLTSISPGWKRNRRELYPMPLRERLPILPIPLREGEKRVVLDLQALIDHTYVVGRYDKLDYSMKLTPPLSVEDAPWAERILKQAGRL